MENFLLSMRSYETDWPAQNEPQNSNPTYPTCLITAPQEAQLGLALRTLLNNNGFSSTNIIGFDHNWDGAATYAIQLVCTYLNYDITEG